MTRTGWTLMGDDAEVRPVEIRLGGQEHRRPYAEVKTEALEKLRSHIEPYVEQIARLESDEFEESRKLPHNKAWQYKSYCGNHAVVTAKTKKRAVELSRETRYGFDQVWSECGGDWWYELATEERVWIEELGEGKAGTGVYYRPLSWEQKREIAREHAAIYQAMSDTGLLMRLGERTSTTSESEFGTPYRIDVTIEASECYEGKILVRVEVDDHLGWCGSGLEYFTRDLPAKPEVDWVADGF